MPRWPARTDLERWADKVLIDNGCWEWAASRYPLPHDYGMFSMRGDDGAWKPRHAHRAGYELLVGPVPDGTFVCHTCDNPGCVKPSHMFLGSHADNMADMFAKGRSKRGKPQPSICGENHPQHKLAESDVREIRQRLDGGETQQSIADHFGIGQSQVSRIKFGRTWRAVISEG